MENIIEEGEIKGAIDPASMQQTKAILEQMERSVCRITSENKNGSGFFCKIELNNKKIPVLITNYHIIRDEFLDSELKIKIYFRNECIPIKLNKDRKVYSSNHEMYDIMILKIYDNDDIQNINYLEIDNNLFKRNSELEYEDRSIYILHYPMGNEVKVSYGYGIKEKNKNNIIHKCKTANGSSGSPILNLSTNKVIGIHKSFSKNTNKDNKEDCYNLGTLLKYPLIEMNSKIDNKKKNIRFHAKDNKLPSQRIENKVEKINEKEKPLVKNTNLNNDLKNKILKIDINRDNSKNDSNKFKNENNFYNNYKFMNNNKVELTPKNNIDKSKEIDINNPNLVFNNNLKNNELKQNIDYKKLYRAISKPQIIMRTPKIENATETINEKEKSLGKNINLNNNFNGEILKLDNKKDELKYDNNTFKNRKISYNNLLSNNKVEITQRNNKYKNIIINEKNPNLNINNNLNNIEPKQINENKQFYRKISKPDIRLQTPKIKNKIESIDEKPEIKNFMKNPLYQKMNNIYNNYNHEYLKTDITDDISKYNSNTIKNEKKYDYNYINLERNNNISLRQRNNNDKKLVSDYCLREINVNPLKERLSTNEDNMPNLNINNEMNLKYNDKKQKNINIKNDRHKILESKPSDYNNQTHENFYPKNSMRMNFNNFNTFDERISVGNNRNEINKIQQNSKNNTPRIGEIKKEIFKNDIRPKSIRANNNPFQKPKDLKLDSANQIQNNQRKINYTPSAANLNNRVETRNLERRIHIGRKILKK